MSEEQTAAERAAAERIERLYRTSLLPSLLPAKFKNTVTEMLRQFGADCFADGADWQRRVALLPSSAAGRTEPEPGYREHVREQEQEP